MPWRLIPWITGLGRSPRRTTALITVPSIERVHIPPIPVYVFFFEGNGGNDLIWSRSWIECWRGKSNLGPTPRLILAGIRTPLMTALRMTRFGAGVFGLRRFSTMIGPKLTTTSCVPCCTWVFLTRRLGLLHGRSKPLLNKGFVWFRTWSFVSFSGVSRWMPRQVKLVVVPICGSWPVQLLTD